MNRVHTKCRFGLMVMALLALPLTRPAQALPVILLDNTGTVGFTAGIIGINLGSPGACCDVRFGDTSPPTPLFMYNGAPISQSNPLPPGATASTGPHASFGPGDFVEFIQVVSDVSPGFPGFSRDTGLSVQILPTPTVIPFDEVAFGTPLVGAFRIVQVPEPGTLGLFAAALATARWAGRRRGRL